MADARLQFLNASARHYAIAAPATAAHLMLQHAQVAEEAGLSYGKDHPSDTCGACGTTAVADGTAVEIAQQQLRAPVTLPSPKLMASPSGTDMRERKCAACHRITWKRAPRSEVSSRGGPQKQRATTATPNLSGALASANSPNKGTAQRPKVRKRGGLQAMVERSRVSRDMSLTSGLDLMDLMKVG